MSYYWSRGSLFILVFFWRLSDLGSKVIVDEGDFRDRVGEGEGL